MPSDIWPSSPGGRVISPAFQKCVLHGLQHSFAPVQKLNMIRPVAAGESFLRIVIIHGRHGRRARVEAHENAEYPRLVLHRRARSRAIWKGVQRIRVIGMYARASGAGIAPGRMASGFAACGRPTLSSNPRMGKALGRRKLLSDSEFGRAVGQIGGNERLRHFRVLTRRSYTSRTNDIDVRVAIAAPATQPCPVLRIRKQNKRGAAFGEIGRSSFQILFSRCRPDRTEAWVRTSP